MLFALRSPLLGALAIAGAVLGAIPIVSYMGVQTARAEAGSAKFRVVAFNVWFRNHDYAAIGRFLEQTQADVIVLEERDRDDGAQRIGAYLPSYPHSFIERRSAWRDRVRALADRSRPSRSRWPTDPACSPRASRSIGTARQ